MRNIYSILVSILFYLLVNITTYGQNNYCQIDDANDTRTYTYSGDCTPDQAGDWQIYCNLNTYIASLDANAPLTNPPLKTIEVNFNIIQKDDGTGNFQDNQATVDMLNQMIAWVNLLYANYSPSDPISWVNELPSYDTRIRFSVGELGSERVYFYQNTGHWNSFSISGPQNYIAQNHPERLNQVNVYIFKTGTGAYANFPSYTDFNYYSYVALHSWNSPGQDWAKATQLAHEFGHSLRLLHTYYGGGASAICDQQHMDFLEDVFIISQPNTSNCPHTCDWYGDANAVNGDGITNNLMGGNISSSYISPMQSGQFHRSLALTSVRKYVVCEKSQIPLLITGNEDWDFDIKLYRDVIVSNNARLTLSCKLSMHNDAKIIVQPGGELIVDEGIITGSNGNFWQGITVIGQQNQPQTTQYQGAVRLMNGAVIENAICGIQLFDRQSDGEPIESTAGGLLLATDSYFKNNKKAIEAGYYSQSGSLINDCEFSIDADYYEKTQTQPIYAHLHEINQFSFSDNLFKNMLTDLSVNTNILPQGIVSFNTAVKARNNIFENLQYGIKAHEINFSNVSEISSNTFTKCFTGIYMSGVHTPQIFFNTFEAIPFNTGLPSNQNFTGIYLDGVEGHSVEENTFFSDLSGIPSQQHRSIGLLVNNGGSQDVEVYKNTFHHLDFAILAQNNNRSSDGLHGLCIKCNDFNYNGSDVSVTTDPFIPASLAGIAKNQGSGASDDNAPAGNLFSQLNSNLQWQFNNINGLVGHITYWHHSNTFNTRLVPDAGYINNVTPTENILADYISACASHQSSGGSGGGLDDAKSRMADADIGEEEAKSTLAALVDAGDTPALQTDISTATPSEAYEIRNELLETAPYTSDDVLIEATEREDVLNNALIRDVLVANPQAAKSEEVLTAIDNRANAMPNYMKDQINEGFDMVSAKEELEAKAFYFSTAYTNAQSDLVYIYLSDTTLSHAMDSVVNLLSTSKNIYARYQLASIYFNKQDYVNMNSALDDIENEFVLNEMMQTEYEQLIVYFDLMQALYSSNRSINQLNSAEKNQLLDWYDNEVNLAAVYARNILNLTGDIDYQEPYILPDELKSSTVEFNTNHQNVSIDNYNMMQLYPNPAKNYLICEYEIVGEFTEASLNIIKSGSGKSLYDLKLNQAQDAKTIDLRELSTGNYIIVLMVDGHQVATGKFSIAK